MTKQLRIARASRKQSVTNIQIENILSKEDIQAVKINRLKAKQCIIEDEMNDLRDDLQQKTNEYYHLSNEINSLT